MSKYTKGPWKIDVSADAKTWENTYRIKSENNGVAIIVGNEANATLISSAPEMLEALEWLASVAMGQLKEKDMDPSLTQDAAVIKAFNVIRKAKGGAE